MAEANLRCIESDHIRFEVLYVGPISPVTAPDAVIVVAPLKAPVERVAVPSVNDPPVTAPDTAPSP